MTLNYAYTPYIWPPLLTVLLMLAMVFYSSRRRGLPGVLLYMISILLAAGWAAGSVMEYAAVDLADKIFWIKFQAASLLPSATAMTCFVLEYAWPGRWMNRRNVTLLSIVPLLVLGLILTDDLHHWMWLGFSPDGPVVEPRLGPAGWLAILYSFGLVVLNFSVFTWLFLRSPQHRWPVMIMVAGNIEMRTVFVLEKAHLIHSYLPVDVIGLAFMVITYAIALFGFRIFDPIPLARQVVIEQLWDGMLVLDPQGRVVSLNPAASKILAAPLKHVQGKPVTELLPRLTGLSWPLPTEAAVSRPIEMDLTQGAERRSYELNFSPLSDFRRLPIGHLLLLHEVTEQRRSQAQILEQQRSLATLHEREQLARELHDSTSQVLGYAGFQLEAISNHIQDGQAAIGAGRPGDACARLVEAETQLSRLSRIVAEGQADIREYILNLRLAPSDQQPFFTSLQQYLEGFSQNYDIQAELSIGPGVKDDSFDYGTQLQLFRIIQEALSNARKHSRARSVQVTVEAQDRLAHICIQDDGCGFDPAVQGRDAKNHFGLRFMHERAEQVGGALRVTSAPGQGTRVMVDVPVKG